MTIHNGLVAAVLAGAAGGLSSDYDERLQLQHRGHDHLRVSGIVFGASLVVAIALPVAPLAT